MATDYLTESSRVTSAFLSYIIDNDANWKSEKRTDGVEIFSRESSSLNGKVYKSQVTLDASPELILAMVSPVKPYRLQWDNFLDKCDVITKVAEDTYLIHHVVKPALKGIVSARDSIDVVSIGKKDNYYYVSAGGVDHMDYPPLPKHVRSFQHPAGYVIFKDDQNANRCKFVMLFHVDLNINQVGNFMINMVKPTLMIQKVNSLREGLKNIKVKDTDKTDYIGCSVPISK